jgi:tetratricopeptide (TPR) repeat protein
MQVDLPLLAANDYRTALSYDRENEQYRLRLAQALFAADRLNEARAHLLSLWEEEPASGEVNLTLARLFAHQRKTAEAVRYYDNAINGVWEEDPRKQRIATRFELARYLMQQHDLPKARAELLALQADGPPDAAGQLLLGQLLLHVNEAKAALDDFGAVVASDPGSAEAWLGKGIAFLQLRQYTDAEHALAEALARNPKLSEARQQLELVREVLRLSPNLRGLSLAERTRRVAENFRTAIKRLTTCATQQGYSLGPLDGVPSEATGGAAKPGSTPTLNATVSAPTGLQLLYSSGLAKQSQATEEALRKNPDSLEPTMQYVFEVERTTASICPNMEVADRALLTLAQHESEMLR